MLSESIVLTRRMAAVSGRVNDGAAAAVGSGQLQEIAASSPRVAVDNAAADDALGPQRPPPPPLLPTARFLFHSIGFLPGVRFDVCPESDCARINHAASTAPSDAPPNAAALC
uniref:Uncharacterized protein n=1 Tax=Plectus sambesii TaxID=2011161 RepID=A0A914XMJ3_9BILA